MNKRFTPLIVFCLFLSSLLLASCSDSNSTVPTVTLDTENCTYSGPKTVPADFTVDWVINDDTVHDYAYVIFTLDEGATREDFEKWLRISPMPPDWINIISREGETAGNTTHTKNHNLTANAAYKYEPLYIVCFIGDKRFLVAGPLKVKK